MLIHEREAGDLVRLRRVAATVTVAKQKDMYANAPAQSRIRPAVGLRLPRGGHRGAEGEAQGPDAGRG
jgi:hypothetical protein